MWLAHADLEGGHDGIDQVPDAKIIEVTPYSSAPRTCTLEAITQRRPRPRSSASRSVAPGNSRTPGTAGTHRASDGQHLPLGRRPAERTQRIGEPAVSVLDERAVTFAQSSTKHGQRLRRVDLWQQAPELLEAGSVGRLDR